MKKILVRVDCYHKRKFLNFSTTNIWVMSFLTWGTILSTVWCLAYPWPHPTACWEQSPNSCNSQKHLQTLSNVPWGQNHSLLRTTAIWQWNWFLRGAESMHPNDSPPRSFKAWKNFFKSHPYFTYWEKLLYEAYLKNQF